MNMYVIMHYTTCTCTLWNVKHLLVCDVLFFIDPIGFGASASYDTRDAPSNQNGYSKNKHLQAAHQQLDDNLGKSLT